jgi:hypothetical protein
MNKALLYLQMQKSSVVEVESKLLEIMDKLHYIYYI